MKRLALFSLISLTLFSCRLEECEDPIPYVEFKEFIPFEGDSARMILGFRDCDGDFGIEEGSSEQYNLFMDYYYYQDSVWILHEPFTPAYYGIDELENRSVSKTLEGEIHVTIEDYSRKFGDTLRYEIYIVDRAKNKSNVVTTPTIIAN